MNIQTTRDIGSTLGEKCVRDVLGNQYQLTDPNCGHDLESSGVKIEVKLRFYGQPANILIDQLLRLHESPEDSYYAILYYRLLGGQRPLATLEGCPKGKSLIDFYQEHFNPTDLFFIPTEELLWFYYTSDIKEQTISSSGLKHRGLSVTQAHNIISTGWGEKKSCSVSVEGFGDMNLYGVGKKVNLLLNNID